MPRLNKLLLGLAGFIFSTSLSASVPDIGTAGQLGLNVHKEEQIGKYFMRTARGMMNIVYDPVLTEYLDSLGNKLVAQAEHVYFPYEFFIVNDQNLNAAAFLGGKIQVNTGLFIYSDTEDEFASVLAHEITHVTQRHIARFLESQASQSTMTLGGLVAAAALSIINPMMGMAALSTAMGLSIQNKINFTRDNEYEADRLGIALLYRAGFNPRGMTDMFHKLLALQGNLNPAFTLLIDHPLSEERVAEATNRIHSYQPRENSKNYNFDFAKARIDVRFKGVDAQNSLDLAINNVEKRSDYYRYYAAALSSLELKDYAKAQSFIDKLLALKPALIRNSFIIDTLTDIDLGAKHYAKAIERLQENLKYNKHHSVTVINLANAYMEHNQFKEAEKLLHDYLKFAKEDLLAHTIYQQVVLKLGDKCLTNKSQGEIFSLRAEYNKAMGFYNRALQNCLDPYEQERIKARVVELAKQREFEENLMKGN